MMIIPNILDPTNDQVDDKLYPTLRNYKQYNPNTGIPPMVIILVIMIPGWL